MLGFRLKGWNLLQKNTKICTYRSRHSQCKDYFSEENGLMCCIDISPLMDTFGIEHNPIEWRLFIDSSKASLKAVLLHDVNKFPSISVAHSASMKETYENFQFMLAKLQYAVYEWNICDLKITALILGLQLGYTKYCCFSCLWDCRNRKTISSEKNGLIANHSFLDLDSFLVKHDALCNPKNVYLPPLHIKLGLMKNFVKAMGNTPGFMFLKQKFEAKIKEGMFVGPQIRSLMHDEKFEKLLNPLKKTPWQAFKNVIRSFLGNLKVCNYRDIVHDLITSYKNLALKIPSCTRT
ncbi:uncharacterized protein TNCV_233051 [Trichonephila clavipes]|nr:uncharacterized protein TNCV_233051 [Trichonephila clavipes]